MIAIEANGWMAVYVLVMTVLGTAVVVGLAVAGMVLVWRRAGKSASHSDALQREDGWCGARDLLHTV